MKCLQCISQGRSQQAGRADATVLTARLKAANEGKVSLDAHHHIANVDLGRLLREREAATVAAHRTDEALLAEPMRDLHHVVLRYPIGFGRFLDRHKTVGMYAELNEHPQRV